MMNIDYAQAHNALRYEEETGKLFWKIRRGGTAIAGSEVGHIMKLPQQRTSYRAMRFLGKRYLQHRVIWLMIHKTWPVDLIDHINGNGLDNRLANLREASRVQNGRNAFRNKRNTTGFKGVSYFKNDHKYGARIINDKERVWLGFFETAEAAHEAYCRAAKDFHGEFARTE